ncbi:uncharacterized protein ACNLHF_011805 [Anomaloglossus baeobatrachus]
MDVITGKIAEAYIEYSYQANVLAYRFSEAQRQRRRQQRRRRYWVHPINETRIFRGVFYTLYLELRRHPEKFINYVRMPEDTFNRLLERVDPFIKRKDTFFRKAISPAEHLLITLRFLATGESYSSLHFQFRVGISTISGIVSSTCQALWECLKDEYIPHPTEQQWMDAAEKFYQICNFPNCCGAMDGKHIRILKLQNTGSEYYNYKKKISVVLMAIADAQYKFLAVDIGAFGRANDSQVLKNSTIGRNLYGGHFAFPQPKPLPQSDGPPLPFVCLGDEAFQLSQNLLKLYSSRGLTHEKKIFNYRLSRARRMVECAFGILTARWRILTTAINVKIETVDEIIKACVILHNFLLSNGVPPLEEEMTNCTLTQYSNVSFRTTTEVLRIRDEFASYFVSDIGRLEWQDTMV